MNARKITALSATAAVVLGAAFFGASSAQAHDKKVDLTCTSINLSLTNYPANSVVDGTLDGQALGATTFNGSFSFSQALDPTVPHTYSLVVKSGDGNARFNINESGKSDPACIPTPPPVVTEPPVEETPEPTPEVTPPAEEPTDEPTETTPTDEPGVPGPVDETPIDEPIVELPEAPVVPTTPEAVSPNVTTPEAPAAAQPRTGAAPVATPVESSAHFTG